MIEKFLFDSKERSADECIGILEGTGERYKITNTIIIYSLVLKRTSH